MDPSGKVAIVTGASSGIGRATARALSSAGASVALVARSKDKLERLASELPASLAVPADMTDTGQVRAMVDAVVRHYGRVDLLVNGAGRGYDAPVERIDLPTFREILDLDVVGPLVAMQALIPIMRKQGGGMIMNVSSGTALMHLPNMSPYSSLKRALADITLTARAELADDKIICSVFYPYMTATAFEDNTIKDASIEDEDGDEGDNGLPPLDSAEYAAAKILECIRSEEAECYAHDWMKGMR